MSKIKTPREKKIASLLLDRRNSYGENDKASRKSVRGGKKRGHQHARRSVRQPLNQIASAVSEEQLVVLESDARVAEIKGKRDRFRKKPDRPLGEHIKNHAYWLARRAGETDYWKARRPDDAKN